MANSWRTQWWDSLRLLTPNWLTRLPGYCYQGDEPDGYLTAREVGQLVKVYATVTAAPVQTHTTVTSVRPDDGGFVVHTDQGPWQARAIVLASGACAVARVPPLHQGVPAGISLLW